MADLSIEVLRRYGRNTIMAPTPTLNAVAAEAARLQEAAPVGAFTPLRPSQLAEALLLSVNSPSASLVAGGALSISGVSGSIAHGGALTINGNSFLTKSPVAPKIWDDCEGTNMLALWDETQSTSTIANMGYRTPAAVGRGVLIPSRGTKYACGVTDGASSGVIHIQKNYSNAGFAYPFYSRWTYWWRMDPNWSNLGGENTDANNKIHTYGCGTSILDIAGGGFYYTEYDDRPVNAGSTCSLDTSDSGSIGMRCQGMSVGAYAPNCWSGGVNYNVAFGIPTLNPITQWIKLEHIIKLDRTAAGSIQIIENGITKLAMAGQTDTITSTTQRHEAIGLYNRARNSECWRYYKDIYWDVGNDALARIEIGTGSTYATRGITEPQVPTAWADGQLQCLVNLGSFASATGRYLYVTDRLGNHNSSGFPL